MIHKDRNYMTKKIVFDNDSLILLFGITRLMVLIHELLGHLLKGKINRITNKKIKIYTKNKTNK